jgi:hypothetical protein
MVANDAESSSSCCTVGVRGSHDHQLWTRSILRPLTIVFKWAHNCDESPLNGARGGSGDQRSGSEEFDSATSDSLSLEPWIDGAAFSIWSSLEAVVSSTRST